MDADSEKSLQELGAHLRQARSLFVIPHWQSDGDCIGSALGFTWAMRQLGKAVTITLENHVSGVFDYMRGFEELSVKSPGDEQVMVLIDGSDRTRFGPLYDEARATGRPLVQIDHHATNTLFADVNWVDTSAGSCAELIYRLITRLGATLDRTIAECLLTGILTDTLVFRTASTTPATLQASIDMVNAGASIPYIVDRVYNRRPFSNLQLFAHVVGRARLEGDVIWSQVSLDEYRHFGLNGNSSVGIINTLLTVDRAQIAVLFSEREDGKVELGLRARVGYDVSQVAFRLGGGGHKQAAGALLAGPLEAARALTLAEIRAYLNGRNGLDGTSPS